MSDLYPNIPEPPKPEEPKAVEAKELQPSIGWRRVLDIAIYPIAVLAGYYPFKITARAGVYKNYAKFDYFDHLQDKFKKLHADVRKPVMDKLFKDPGHVFSFLEGPGPQFSQLTEDYRLAVRDQFRRMGIDSVHKYWKNLN